MYILTHYGEFVFDLVLTLFILMERSTHTALSAHASILKDCPVWAEK